MIQEVVPLAKSGKGLRAKVPEKDISRALLDYFQGRIIAFEQDLFLYKQGYWNLLNFSERNRIKVPIEPLAPTRDSGH